MFTAPLLMRGLGFPGVGKGGQKEEELRPGMEQWEGNSEPLQNLMASQERGGLGSVCTLTSGQESCSWNSPWSPKSHGSPKTCLAPNRTLISPSCRYRHHTFLL